MRATSAMLGKKLVLLCALLLAAASCASGSTDDEAADPGVDGDAESDDSASAEPEDDEPAGTGELREVTLRTDWTPLGYHAPFLVAVEEGYFAEEGLEVNIGEGSGSATTAQVVANQQDEFGLADMSAVMGLMAEGAPFKAVAQPVQQTTFFLTAREDAGINSPSDLEGRTVGVSAGGSDQQILPVFLEAAGVDADLVEVTTFDASAKVGAITEGRVDATLAHTTAQLPVFEDMGVDVTVIPLSDYMTVLSFAIITSDAMIAEEPEVVQAFVSASQRGWERTIEDPEAAIDLLVQRFEGVEADIALRQLEEALLLIHSERTEGEPFGVPAEQDVLDTEAVLADTVGLEITGDASNYFDFSFTP